MQQLNLYWNIDNIRLVTNQKDDDGNSILNKSEFHSLICALYACENQNKPIIDVLFIMEDKNEIGAINSYSFVKICEKLKLLNVYKVEAV